MLSRVPGRTSSVTEGFEAILSGDYYRGLALLHRLEMPGCALMRIKALVRLEQYDRALQEFERRDISTYSHREGLQIAAYITVSYAYRGQLDEFEAMAAKLNALRYRSSDALGPAFVETVLAMCACVGCDYGTTRQRLAKAWKALGDRSYPRPQSPQDIDPQIIKAMLFDIEAVLEGIDGNFAMQAELSIKATVTAADIAFERSFEANTLHNLANLIARTPSKTAHDLLIARGNSFPWAPNTIRTESYLRAQIELSALAFGFPKSDLQFGGRTAPTLEFRLMYCIDKLLRAHYSDSREFLAECRFCIALTLELSANDGFTLSPLFLSKLAAVIAPFDFAISRKVLEIRDSFLFKSSRRWYYSQEPHSKAVGGLARGCIAKAEDDIDEAVDQLGSVMRILDGALDPVVAIAGVERFTLTRDFSDLTLADAFTREYPTSSFSQRLKIALSGIKESAPGDFPYLGMYGLNARLAARAS